jgi:mannose-6-phosphate isomerase-like protein (cupin superfamily)
MRGEPHVVGPEGVAAFESPAGEAVVVRASGNESGGSYDLVELTIDPGPGVTPMHVHHENDEAMYVLEGERAVKLGDDRRLLEAGSYTMGPRGVPHTYRNSDHGRARVFFVNSPGNNWRYLQEAGEHGPVEDDSDIERLLPILESHGVEMVGPPLDADGDE